MFAHGCADTWRKVKTSIDYWGKNVFYFSHLSTSHIVLFRKDCSEFHILQNLLLVNSKQMLQILYNRDWSFFFFLTLFMCFRHLWNCSFFSTNVAAPFERICTLDISGQYRLLPHFFRRGYFWFCKKGLFSYTKRRHYCTVSKSFW